MKGNENMYSSFYSKHLKQFNVPSDNFCLSSFFFILKKLANYGSLWRPSAKLHYLHLVVTEKKKEKK